MSRVTKSTGKNRKLGVQIWTHGLFFFQRTVPPLRQPFGIWRNNRVLDFSKWHQVVGIQIFVVSEYTAVYNSVVMIDTG